MKLPQFRIEDDQIVLRIVEAQRVGIDVACPQRADPRTRSTLFAAT